MTFLIFFLLNKMLLFPNQLFEYKYLKPHLNGSKIIYMYKYFESKNSLKSRLHELSIAQYKTYLKKFNLKLKETLLIPNVKKYDPANKYDLSTDLKSPMWFNLDIKPGKRFNSFYKAALKQLNLPFERSYDELNRESKLEHVPPKTIKYVYNHKDAKSLLNDFIELKLKYFGPYQDIIKPGYLFHSNLSHALNLGLLTPRQVLKKVMKQDAPINSKEGFVRQLIWREYMYYLYKTHVKEDHFSKFNMFDNSNKLSKVWWTASTGIDFVDDVLRQFIETGYNHHIQRLMILGNIFTLLEIDPKEAFNWFMQYIDAYEWVMYGNIIMAMHTEPLFTKPYVASTNYISKMSDYKRNEEFDTLYYAWVTKHYDYLNSHGRFYAKKYQYDTKKLESIKKRLVISN